MRHDLRSPAVGMPPPPSPDPLQASSARPAFCVLRLIIRGPGICRREPWCCVAGPVTPLVASWLTSSAWGQRRSVPSAPLVRNTRNGWSPSPEGGACHGAHQGQGSPSAPSAALTLAPLRGVSPLRRWGTGRLGKGGAMPPKACHRPRNRNRIAMTMGTQGNTPGMGPELGGVPRYELPGVSPGATGSRVEISSRCPGGVRDWVSLVLSEASW